MFLTAVKLAAPMMVALSFKPEPRVCSSRTVPQVNILMVGLLTRRWVHLLILTINSMSPLMTGLFKKMGQALIGLINLM